MWGVVTYLALDGGCSKFCWYSRNMYRKCFEEQARLPHDAMVLCEQKRYLRTINSCSRLHAKSGKHSYQI